MTKKENSIERFVRDAVEGGWKPFGGMTLEDYKFDGGEDISCDLLDKDAWIAVGKVRGWKRPKVMWLKGDTGYTSRWANEMLTFISHLADGKTIEEALNSLER